MTEFGMTAEGQQVQLDIRALVESNAGVIGNPGSGKSRTCRKILELAAGQAQRIVLDVEDEYYTLREQTPSMLLAGGRNGDCPATPANAAALASLLLETGIDAVIQLNDLGLEGQREFIRLFVDALVDAEPRLWHPLLLLVDEAHRYVPLRGWAASGEAIIRLALQGRKRTFGLILATPRLSGISTDARGMLNNWLLGRASQKVDKQAAAEQLGVTNSSDEARGLAKLQPGNFWCFGPALDSEPALVRIGEVVTTHLRPGQRDVPTPPAPEQIRAMLERLPRGEQPASATAEAGAASAAPMPDDVERLRREAFSRGEFAGFKHGYMFAMTVMVETLSIDEKVILRDIRSRLRQGLQQTIAVVLPTSDEGFVAALEKAKTEGSEFHDIFPPGQDADDVPRDAMGEPLDLSDLDQQDAEEQAAATPEPIAPRVEPVETSSSKITGPMQRMLDALAWWQAAGIMQPTRAQLALLAGYSPRSSAFSNPLGALRSAGLIDYPMPGSVALQTEGRALPPRSRRPQNFTGGSLSYCRARSAASCRRSSPPTRRRSTGRNWRSRPAIRRAVQPFQIHSAHCAPSVLSTIRRAESSRRRRCCLSGRRREPSGPRNAKSRTMAALVDIGQIRL
jgi:hypothetical protein